MLLSIPFALYLILNIFFVAICAYYCCHYYQRHIGVDRILSAGVHFFTIQEKLLKIDSCSGWGVHLVSCGGALTHFPCKLGLKKIFFTALGGAGAPTAPPGYAYVSLRTDCVNMITLKKKITLCFTQSLTKIILLQPTRRAE